MEEGVVEGERERLSLGFESFSRDLLRRFGGNGSANELPEATGGDSDEIELTLGLSLGGCFGEDPKGKKLVKSSSIASFSSVLKEQQEFPAVAATALMRTSSLPTETEEEQRKRKEMQSLKRLEAKRKRLERKNSMKSGTLVKAGEKSDEDMDGANISAPAINGYHGFTGGSRPVGPVNGVVAPPGLPSWLVGSKRPTARALDAPGYFPPVSQGSIGSQSSSSVGGLSDLDCRAVQGYVASGFSHSSEVKSPSSHAICDHNGISKLATTPPGATVLGRTASSVKGDEDPSKKDTARVNGVKVMAAERNMMEEMPCVSTRGDGPNGRRIEGFLYKYRKGEDVRIVCVCHGSFLTPAEFVKHAGGGDVAHPLRHIVVNPSPSAFL